MAKFKIVQELTPEYQHRSLCQVLGVSPSSHFYKLQNEEYLQVLSRMEGILLPFSRCSYRRDCPIAMRTVFRHPKTRIRNE